MLYIELKTVNLPVLLRFLLEHPPISDEIEGSRERNFHSRGSVGRFVWVAVVSVNFCLFSNVRERFDQAFFPHFGAELRE
jgi:hypothetical protein